MRKLSLVNLILCGALGMTGAAVGFIAPEKWHTVHSLAIFGTVITGIGSLIVYKEKSNE